MITQFITFPAGRYRKELRFWSTLGLPLPSHGLSVWDSRRNQQRAGIVAASAVIFFMIASKLNPQRKKTSIEVERTEI